MNANPLIVRGPFSRSDTNLIKGLGILMIMFHNFFHLIDPEIGENEFTFSADNFKRFIHFAGSYPLDIIRFISSYLGHYGVQLFIFMSSYGLYLAYKNKNIRWLNFMKRRIGKLYPSLVLGIALFMLVYVFQLKILPGLEVLKSSLLKLTLVFGFIPNEALSLSGPWWFFSVIAQLYALFPLLLWGLRKTGPDALVAIAFLFIGISMILNLFVKIPGYSVYFTFIGQMPVFSLGLYFAVQPQIKISKNILIISIVVFALGNLNQYAWYFSFVAITLILLTGAILLIPIIRKFKFLNSFLEFTGSISLFLFVVNGVLREPLILIAERYANAFITLGLSLFFIAFVYFVALIIRLLEKQLLEFIGTGYKIFPLLKKMKTNDY
jgi:peptidoglycan/LPS O-acetylase OafA/YrhL